MKTQIWFLTLLIALSFTFTGCNNPQNRAGENDNDGSIETEMTEVIYTCPMHPEVTASEPGDCPKCGMDLVKMEDLKHDQGADSSLDTLHL